MKIKAYLDAYTSRAAALGFNVAVTRYGLHVKVQVYRVCVSVGIDPCWVPPPLDEEWPDNAE